MTEMGTPRIARFWTFAAACPVEPWWGGRDMILFDGAVDAVSTIGRRNLYETRIQRQCPQWWWPDDRAWFGTEIDHAWTYVAGSRSLIDEVLASPHWVRRHRAHRPLVRDFHRPDPPVLTNLACGNRERLSASC